MNPAGRLRAALAPYLIIGAGLVLSVGYVLGITDWSRIASSEVALSNLKRFFPPNVAEIPGLFWPTVDTLLMAVFATILIAIIVPPVVWLSAHNISPNRFTVWIGRGIVICSRSIHELVWGLLFVIAVGLGPLAGILALAKRYVQRIVALKAGIKVFDGAADALDFESVYKLSEPRPSPAAGPNGGLTMETAR